MPLSASLKRCPDTNPRSSPPAGSCRHKSHSPLLSADNPCVYSEPLHLVLQGGALEAKPGRRSCRTRQRAPGLPQNLDDVFAFPVAQRNVAIRRLPGDFVAQLGERRIQPATFRKDYRALDKV